MKINDYVSWTEATCAKLPSQELDVVHMLMGMTTEVGELTDVFKKKLAYNKDIDWVNVIEEIGDLMFYLASFCRLTNLNLEAIIETNIAKLESRYPEKFSSEKAINRDLEEERKVLENKKQ